RTARLATGAMGKEERVGADLGFAHRSLGRLDQREVALRVEVRYAEPPAEPLHHRCLIERPESLKRGDQRRRFADRTQGNRELGEVPVDRLRLAAERVKPAVVEVGCGELLLP